MTGWNGLALLGALCGVAAVVRTPAETVRELVLVDDEGKPRARLGITEGRPLLELFDESGKTRAAFGLNPGGDGAALELMNTSGTHPRVQLRTEDPGQHGSVDYLTFRYDDSPGEGSAVRLGHGGFGEGAYLVLANGDESISLETHPFSHPGATILLKGAEFGESPAYWMYCGRLPRGEAGNHPTLAVGTAAASAELQIRGAQSVVRLRSGEDEMEWEYPEEK